MSSNNSHMPSGEYIGLDVGEKRIGVARINSVARIGEPLPVIDATADNVHEIIQQIAHDRGAVGIVVGLPRGLDGQESSQTEYSREFARQLSAVLSSPVYVIDEAGSTKAAEERQSSYPQASIDSLAATVFLEDFIHAKDIDNLQVR